MNFIAFQVGQRIIFLFFLLVSTILPIVRYGVILAALVGLPRNGCRLCALCGLLHCFVLLFLFLQRKEDACQQKVDILNRQSAFYLNTACTAAMIGTFFAVTFICVFRNDVQNQLFLLLCGLAVTGFTLAGFTLVGFTFAGFTLVGFTLAGFTFVGFTLAGFTFVGFTVVGFTVVGFTFVGFTFVGFTLAGFIFAGFTLAGFIFAGFTLAGFIFAITVPGAFLRCDDLHTAGINAVFDNDGDGLFAAFQRRIHSLLNGIGGSVVGVDCVFLTFDVSRSLRDLILGNRLCRFSVCGFVAGCICGITAGSI